MAATNALELGVDVGSLDCTLHLGFPGSIASLWQQAGRAGRREQASLGIYLGWDGPLDQVTWDGGWAGRPVWVRHAAAAAGPLVRRLVTCRAMPCRAAPCLQYFLRHPAQLFGRPIERAMLDARNPAVLGEMGGEEWQMMQGVALVPSQPLPLLPPLIRPLRPATPRAEAHVACAAAEAPLLLDGDQEHFGPGLPALAAGLRASQLLGPHPLAPPSSTALHYVGAVGNPASKIRQAGTQRAPAAAPVPYAPCRTRCAPGCCSPIIRRSHPAPAACVPSTPSGLQWWTSRGAAPCWRRWRRARCARGPYALPPPLPPLPYPTLSSVLTLRRRSPCCCCPLGWPQAFFQVYDGAVYLYQVGYPRGWQY